MQLLFFVLVTLQAHHVIIAILAILVIVVSLFYFSRNRLIQSLKVDEISHLMSFTRFMQKADKLLTKTNERYVLISVNMVRFRYINYLYGPEIGNKILGLFGATVLSSIDKKKEYATRQASDRFLVLLRYRHNEDFEITMANFYKKFEVAAKTYCSFEIIIHCGVYVMKKNENIHRALEKATHALSYADDYYQPQFVFYTHTMNEEIEQARMIDQEFSTALKERQFAAYYQPKVDIVSGLVLGAEALVRWHHPIKGLLTPGQFLPRLEKNGMIKQIDLYMLDTVCQDIRRNLDEGRLVVPVSINFSATQLYDQDLLRKIKDIIDPYHIPHYLIEIEITEGVAVKATHEVKNLLRDLKAYGLRICIDDFGTGYSSLAVLCDIDADVLKLDRSFLEKNDNLERQRAVLRATVDLAKDIGMSVVFEGVENQEQLAMMKEIDGTIAQGYLFSRPISASDYEQFLLNHQL